MIVPDIIYYSMLIAWVLFLFLFSSIKEKTGALIWPLTVIFGGVVFCITPQSNKLFGIDLTTSIHFTDFSPSEIIHTVASILILVIGFLLLRFGLHRH